MVQNGLRRTEHTKCKAENNSLLNRTNVPSVSEKIGAKFKKTAFWLDLQDTLNDAVTKVKKLCESAEREAELAGSLKSAQFQEKTSKHLEEAASRSSATNRRAIGQWLNPVQNIEDFRAARQRAEGSCRWIDKERAFVNWLETENAPTSIRLFWVKGMPGCGKTLLATRIIGKAQAIAPTAYFFCNTGDVRKRSCLPILGTWVWQLLQQRKDLLPIVQNIFDTVNSRVSQPWKTYFKTLY